MFFFFILAFTKYKILMVEYLSILTANEKTEGYYVIPDRRIEKIWEGRRSYLESRIPLCFCLLFFLSPFYAQRWAYVVSCETWHTSYSTRMASNVGRCVCIYIEILFIIERNPLDWTERAHTSYSRKASNASYAHTIEIFARILNIVCERV